jgi:uncharacterized protein
VRSRSRQLPRPGLERRDELQLSIFVRAGDMVAGRPLYHEILDRLQHAGLRGASAVRGMQGFGASGQLRAPGLTGLTGHEPVLIQVTDDAASVRAFISEMDELPRGGLIVLTPVVALRPGADVCNVATSTPA